MNTKTLRKRKAPANLTYHPTKGYRRVSNRRWYANQHMQTIFAIARLRREAGTGAWA